MESKYPLRVIIVGGGVAGLTLANALEAAGIDFILLERRSEIVPNIGQSIAINCNGCRILDQIGVLDEWDQHSQATINFIERSQGKILFQTDGLHLNNARFGYGLLFGERSKFLSILYKNIKNKTKVLVNQHVSSIHALEDGVTVKTVDGKVYEGDIVVGADGVRSHIRQELWRLAEPTKPKLVDQDRRALFAEYRCLFGIAHTPSDPSIAPGDFDVLLDKDSSALIFAGPQGDSYYFLFEKLDKLYYGADIPQFTKEQATAYAHQNKHMIARPNLTFGNDYWQENQNYTLVPIEEGKFKLWTFGRIACVGDSVHKMTPNIGAGGNSAIESAAALANAIKSIAEQSLKSGHHPSQELIHEELERYQKNREKRVNHMVDRCSEVTRIEASRGLFYRIMGHLFRVYPGESIDLVFTEWLTDSVSLNYLPFPKRSLQGLLPFNPTQGELQTESRLYRALLALPFLALFYFFMSSMNIMNAVPWLLTIVQESKVVWKTGSAPLLRTFYHIKQLDDFLVPINAFFSPVVYAYDEVCRKQTRTFLMDFGVILAIWYFESVRRANVLTIATIPLLFTFAGQLLGIGVVAPIYYFLTYVFTPIEKFKSTERRLGRINYSATVVPVLLLVYYLPGVSMFQWPTFAGRDHWLFVWQLYPIWLSLGTQIFSSFLQDTTITDRFTPRRDLPVLNYSIGALSALSAMVWAWTFLTSASLKGFFDLFIPVTMPTNSPNLTTCVREFLKFDEISLLGNTFIWLGYFFWDMKAAGMVETSWLQLLSYLITSTLFLGPGATAGLGWLWREHILANRRHKDAITEEYVARKKLENGPSKVKAL